MDGKVWALGFRPTPALLEGIVPDVIPQYIWW